MTIAFKKRRRRESATRSPVVETEVARLLLLSLPPAHRVPTTSGKR
jgi:hypothetical protein